MWNLVLSNQPLPCLFKLVTESFALTSYSFAQVTSFGAQVPCGKEKVVETSLKSIGSICWASSKLSQSTTAQLVYKVRSHPKPYFLVTAIFDEVQLHCDHLQYRQHIQSVSIVAGKGRKSYTFCYYASKGLKYVHLLHFNLQINGLQKPDSCFG